MSAVDGLKDTWLSNAKHPLSVQAAGEPEVDTTSDGGSSSSASTGSLFGKSSKEDDEEGTDEDGLTLRPPKRAKR